MLDNMDSVLAVNIAMQAELQRKVWEERAEETRRRLNQQRLESYRSVALSIFVNAELGPMYAMLNPDPRAYGIARAGADKVQAAALQFMADLAGENSTGDPLKTGV